VRLELGAMHPRYPMIIERILRPLVRDYPRALNKITTFEPYKRDRSLGYASSDRSIHLNKFWFKQAPEVLMDAAKIGMQWRFSELPKWHAEMQEPDHVVIHEFAHCVRLLMGASAEDFCSIQFEKVRRNPKIAPTGYCLVSPEECWADTFALTRLSATGNLNPIVKEMRSYLGLRSV
jgi:hypothetical protein